MRSLEIEYVGEPRKEVKPWDCPNRHCRAINMPERRTFFEIPKLVCGGCGIKYLDIPGHTLKFSLADIKANGEPLVRRVYNQGSAAECIANACVQTMDIMHTVKCVLEGKEVTELNLVPAQLFLPYNKQYPKTRKDAWTYDNSVHKFAKMALKLRSVGLRTSGRSYYKVGDVSTIPASDYEQIVEQLADGIPLLGTFFPGIGFPYLSYGQRYLPPLMTDVCACNHRPDVKPHHVPHMVSILGSDCNGMRGFQYINSWGDTFCPRTLLEVEPNAVSAGISSFPADDSYWNPVKLWQPGETCSDPQSRLEDEFGDATAPGNFWKVHGLANKYSLL